MKGIVILAAGASTRLGKPKQLLRYRNQNLLQHAINTAVEAAPNTAVIVVLGANAEVIKGEITQDEIELVINNDWAEGMASSIRVGVTALLATKPETTDVLLMVADQPFVTPQILLQLEENKHESGKDIVACFYNRLPAVPALFGKKFFPELLKMKGTDGARKLFAQYPDDVASITFPAGSIDIDTAEDFNALMANEKNYGKDYFNTWC